MEYSILSYHADPTGQMLSTSAIQAAIDTCRYVTISGCIIDTGDDAIALRCDGEPGWMQDIRLKDIHITLTDNPAASTQRDFEEWGGLLFYCACTDGITLDNVCIDHALLDMSLWRDTMLIENCGNVAGAVTFRN